ncbi:hypothetical protein PsYK624_077950 [Phanerochaete sordida]|uniref:AB hydrolase-1 domain-containing protein n=1 Tax=Phanerochaete sordida TaxID=48140 RepID=A0A9P3LDV3_9APHY|nr:hypothetical protein PsYK624_077950 [Phanerochaete sordida]
MVNSAIFERMLPHAAKHGLRIIAMNSRDYSESTPYTPDELSDFTSHRADVQDAAVRRWGFEICSFLAYVCSQLAIPRVTGLAEKKRGGLVLLTWSLSNMAAAAVLGDTRTMGDKLTSRLAPYLRMIVLYDTPALTLGVGPNLMLTWPMADPGIPVDQKAAKFNEWVSTYYTPHPDGAPITAESLHARTELPRTPTLCAVSSAELQRVTNPEIAFRAGLIVNADPCTLRRHARTMFLDADAVLPEVEVVAVWCDQTFWLAVWGAKVVKEFIDEQPDAGKRKRKASMLMVKDANHFLHWDEPERMVHLLAKICTPFPPSLARL